MSNRISGIVTPAQKRRLAALDIAISLVRAEIMSPTHLTSDSRDDWCENGDFYKDARLVEEELVKIHNQLVKKFNRITAATVGYERDLLD